MSNLISERLLKLRNEMRARGITACIIPSSDTHMSEYINECFKYRQYFSGFTGSAGTLFLTLDGGSLITDGRYFLQAEKQLEGTGIKLVRQGIKGEPDIFGLCERYLNKGDRLFVDGTLISAFIAGKLAELADKNGFIFETSDNPVKTAAADMPPQTFSTISELPDEISGETTLSKIERIRCAFKENGANAHLIASLEEIAWILNFRGNDIKNTCVFYAFLYIDETDVYAFLNTEAAAAVADSLRSSNIKLVDYSEFYGFIKNINQKKVMLDKKCVNAYAVTSLPDGTEIIDKEDPAIAFKAVKNEVEIENSKRVHLYDGLAVARFMHYIKNTDVSELTEISASDKLAEFRKMSPDYIGDSFDTICAYGVNGATVHYSATEETNTKLEPRAALLVDSGGQYMGGTTDITRMFILGDTTEEFKIHYTAVCKSMLRLMSAVFLKDTKCAALDMLARTPLWQLGLDYRHGTGHGVGYMLSVHEPPQRIHVANVTGSIVPGMITSDEPGVYITGKHGIRIENEVLCIQVNSNEYGEFYGFFPLTVCPIDKDSIIPEMLDESDKQALNEYHKFVFEKLSGLVNEDEIDWLIEYTSPIE